MSVSINVYGTKTVQKALAKVGADLHAALASALYKEGEKIMGDSKQNYVPVKSGVLRDSGHVLPPRTDPHGLVVILGFGGPGIPYAIRQHEEVYWQHTVGSAKYLEIPALERAGTMGKDVAALLRARLAARVT